jgi:hypothetical protein
MRATGATVVVAAQMPSPKIFHAEVVATLGPCSEDRHYGAPCAPVRCSARPEQVEGHQVSRFVGNRLGKERLRITLQQERIVANQEAAPVCSAELASALPTKSKRILGVAGAAPNSLAADARNWRVSTTACLCRLLSLGAALGRIRRPPDFG